MSDEEWLKGFRRHQAEWDRYTKQMGRFFSNIDHDFTGGDNTCKICGVASTDVHAGSASWVCAAREMKCCGKIGTEKWNIHSAQWQCSECKAVTSTDYSYVSWPNFDTDEKIKKNEDLFKPVQTDPNRKCYCTINTLMVRGCQCGGK